MLPFEVTPERLLVRDVAGGLVRPGRCSPNGSCRLVAAQDGWVALNLARADDRELIPALTDGGEGWESVERFAAGSSAASFLAAAVELHLPAARVGEASPIALSGGGPVSRFRVVDLSALWAGPLCAALLGRSGAPVLRIGNAARFDPTGDVSPGLDGWLNGGKSLLSLDFRTNEGRARLQREVAGADVLITSARRDALARLGLTAELFERNPALVWIAITAHGWTVDRVGFGDDCAAAGGLLGRTAAGPVFIGDALADPLTGLEGALAALELVAAGRGGLVDLPLAGVAAAYAERAVA